MLCFPYLHSCRNSVRFRTFILSSKCDFWVSFAFSVLLSCLSYFFMFFGQLSRRNFLISSWVLKVFCLPALEFPCYVFELMCSYWYRILGLIPNFRQNSIDFRRYKSYISVYNFNIDSIIRARKKWIFELWASPVLFNSYVDKNLLEVFLDTKRIIKSCGVTRYGFVCRNEFVRDWNGDMVANFALCWCDC